MKRVAAASWIVAGLVGAASARAAGPSKQECVAANDAAQDLRMQHKLRAAREKLALCVSEACPGPVREDCAQRLEELDRAMPTVVFEATDPAGTDLAAVRVTLDGRTLADKLDGGAIAIDPGEHRLVFEAEGRPAVEKTVVLREGEKDRRLRVVMAGETSAEASRPAAVAVPAAAAPSDGGGQRAVGWVLGGAGVVGAVVGSVFGVMAKSTYEQASLGCRAGTAPCSPSDSTHGSDAHGQAAIATGAFVAGGALLAGGIVVYLTAPRASVAVTPAVGANGAALRMEARW